MRAQLTKDLLRFSERKLMDSISDKKRYIELFAVIMTAIGKFVFMDYLNWRLPFVVVAIIFWTGYIYVNHKKGRNILKYWGFRTDNFKAAVKLVLPFAIVSLVLFFVIGFYQNTLNLTWHILPILVTYPIWGIIQQFLIIALVAGNLKDIKGVKLNKWLILLITAMLFSLVHLPNMWLMVATFVLALFYTTIYFKIKNIYVMGIFHGWLGAFFYYTVVNEDPFKDIFLILL